MDGSVTFSPRLWFRRLVLLPLSPALCGLLTGCSFLGSPTEFKLTAPVQTAGNGDSVIFKDSFESVNCALWGGAISLAALARSGGEGRPDLRMPSRRTTPVMTP
jgi:hypothetical protein